MKPDVVDRRWSIETCHVHACGLQTEEIAAHYPTVSWDREVSDAEETLFPLAHIPEGSYSEDRDVRWALMSYCPECRAARRRFVDEHEAGKKRETGVRVDGAREQ